MKKKIIVTNALIAFFLMFLLVLEIISPAYFSIGMIVLMLGLLVTEAISPELVLVSTLFYLLLGAFLHNSQNPFLTPEDAFIGFSNSATVTIGALFLIVAAVKRSGLFNSLAHWTLGGLKSERFAIVRMFFPLASLSAFFNNTPIVAIFLPVIKDWCVGHKIASSKLLIPLSYLTIFGGACTLIGTSTNLVLNGLYVNDGNESLNLFDFAYLGIPCAIVGAIYLATAGSRLLPEREDSFITASKFLKKYLLQMKVKPKSRLAGMSIHDAGLRDLEDRFLIEIHREDKVIAPVRREMLLKEDDKLVFSSSHKSILKLHQIEGLSNIQDCHSLAPEDNANLIEVVISANSSLLGKTIEDVWFNRKYDATVLALHRDGHQIVDSFATTPLKRGDTLLLLVGFGFKKIWQDSQDFLSVSLVDERNETQKNEGSSLICLLIIASMVILPAFNIVPILYTSLFGVLLFVVLGYLPWKNVTSYIDWNVLIIIASSFGISRALTQSKASDLLANNILDLTSSLGITGLIIVIFLFTNILTEVVTNNAAVAIAYPIVASVALSTGLEVVPLVLTMAIAASASFATPIGYQTNMLVYGPGGYKYTDYLKVGLPLNLLFLLITCILVPLIWNFN